MSIALRSPHHRAPEECDVEGGTVASCVEIGSEREEGAGKTTEAHGTPSERGVRCASKL